jgi:hypothetical protein
MVVNGKAEFIAIVDWNHNSIPDIFLSDGTLSLFLGRGPGVFSKVLSCGIDLQSHRGRHNPPIIADFDGDGLWDIPNVEALFLGMVECNFSKKTLYPKTVKSPLLTEDFNGDGFRDLLIDRTFSFESGNSKPDIRLFLGNGQGNLTEGEVVFTSTMDGTDPDLVFAGDMDGDGRLDLLTRGITGEQGVTNIKILLNTCK